MTMTGSAATSVVYEPDGLQSRFPVPFPVFHTGDVHAVSVDGAQQIALTNYTVEGVGTEEGVHVKFSVPPDFGPKLVLYRWTKRVQESDYPEGGRFPAKVVEADFDRLVAMAQEVDDQLEWTLKIPRGADTTPAELRNRCSAVGMKLARPLPKRWNPHGKARPPRGMRGEWRPRRGRWLWMRRIRLPSRSNRRKRPAEVWKKPPI